MPVFLSLLFALVLAALLLSLRRDRGRLRTATALCLSLGLFLVGMNIQARWVFFIASLLLAATVVSSASAFRTLRGLQVDGGCRSEWFTEGEVAEVEVRVRNRGKRARGPLLVVERGWEEGKSRLRRRAWLKAYLESLSGRLASRVRLAMGEENGDEGEGKEKHRTAGGKVFSMGEEARIYIPRLGPGEEAEARIPRRLERRGYFRASRVELRSGGLTGLSSSLRMSPLSGPVGVLPRYRELARLFSLPGEAAAERQPQGGRPHGHGPDFFGIREYRRGDPLRFVHWRSSARVGQLVVREFEREGGRSWGLIIVNPEGYDAGPPGNTLMDEAARVAATLALHSLREGGRFRLLFGLGDEVVDVDTDDFELARRSLLLLGGFSRRGPAELLLRAEEGLPEDMGLLALMPLDRRHPEWLRQLSPSRRPLGLLLLDADPFIAGGTVGAGEEYWGSLPEGWEVPPGAELLGIIRGSEEMEGWLPDF